MSKTSPSMSTECVVPELASLNDRRLRSVSTTNITSLKSTTERETRQAVDSDQITTTKLKFLPREVYRRLDNGFDDPVRFYFFPILGRMYRRRVELCLSQCRGGQRVLDVGFGAGLTFLNLSEMYDEIYGLDLRSPVERVHDELAAHHIETHLQNGNVVDMPYPDCFLDTVLLVSILEHLKPDELSAALAEIHRVLKPGGQVVYGAPIERPLMVFMFRLLGYDIREHHFSTEGDIRQAAQCRFKMVRNIRMKSVPRLFGDVYEVGHFVKAGSTTDTGAPSKPQGPTELNRADRLVMAEAETRTEP